MRASTVQKMLMSLGTKLLLPGLLDHPHLGLILVVVITITTTQGPPSQSMNPIPLRSPISTLSRGGSSTLCGTNSTHDPPATPSSRASAARLTDITAALEGLVIDAYYVVIRGCQPGVYTSRYVSAARRIFLFLLLIFEFSSAALAATGSNVRGLCCVVATQELANAMFVENAMMGDVQKLLQPHVFYTYLLQFSKLIIY